MIVIIRRQYTFHEPFVEVVFGSCVADFVASEEGQMIQHGTSDVVDAIIKMIYHYNNSVKGNRMSSRLHYQLRSQYHNHRQYDEPYHIQNSWNKSISHVQP